MTNAKRLLAAHAGYREYVHSDPERPGELIVETVQDCEPIVEAAKRLSDTEPGKDFRHVAFIPDFVMAQAAREGWINDREAWKRWANNADNRLFRTWPKRV